MPPVLLREFDIYRCVMNTTLDKCFPLKSLLVLLGSFIFEKII
jgi:hypothetical protein